MEVFLECMPVYSVEQMILDIFYLYYTTEFLITDLSN